ncbi:MAG TPA: long-chain fatty acid--CoA ligase [Gemmatimonadaceae bacterium]|nr:long-chain fatty acid--CoA ligase [Gemmatimonadaceae bacterium]
MTVTSTAPMQARVSGGPRAGAPATLAALFFDAVRSYDKPAAMLHKVGGEWRPISHKEFAERVRHVALGLRTLGVERGGRVALLSDNRPEWAITDFACVTSGAVDVPIYPTLPPDKVAYILRDSGATVLFVSTAEQAAKIAAIRRDVPALTSVVSFDEPTPPGADRSLRELEAAGRAHDSPEHRARYEAEAAQIRPDDLATIIYTSGTTGEPKGTMLSHDNLASNVHATGTVVPIRKNDEVALSFLPLSHVFERMAGHYLMYQNGITVAFAESMDLLVKNFAEVRPTIVTAVPRVYEKIYARVLENALAGSAIKKRIFFWARGVGQRVADARLAGRAPSAALGVQAKLADRLVFSKLRARVGGRMRYFVSGGAPLAPEINKFFYSAGLTIFEGYGLTETSPVISVNTPEHFRIGTVGRPIPGVEVAIAADGEILTRGPHVMQGYYNKPEATAEAIDAEGWFHTGDIGQLEDGFLRITDRKKDIIVTAGGKNIAPQPIENQVKTNKYVSQAVMIGDRRKYPVMLVVPNFEQLERWAKIKNLIWTDRRQLLALDTTRAKMEKEVFGALQDLARYEMPKKIGLLENDFSIESGELTPKLSVKRRVVDERYKDVIDTLYVDSTE